MIVVSLDNGAGTGISTYDTVTGAFHTEESHGFEETCHRIAWHLAALNDIVCVAESYIITARTARLTQQTDSLRLNGVAEWECLKRNIPFSLQPPAARKKGEALLKTMGWFVRSKDDHSNSSSGHLLVYLLKHNLLTQSDKFKIIEALD